MSAARKWDRKPVSDRDRDLWVKVSECRARKWARERDGMKVTSSELAEIMWKPMAKNETQHNQIGGSKSGTSFRSRKPVECMFIFGF